MADFQTVIFKAIAGLAENTPELRQKVYSVARRSVRRHLGDMKPQPPRDLLERQLEKLDDAIEFIESSIRTRGLAELASEIGPRISGFEMPLVAADTHRDDFLEVPPPVPVTQELGPVFEISNNGLLTIVSAHHAKPDDLKELSPLRDALVPLVDDLLAMTRKSNAHSHLAKVVEGYKAALAVGEELPIDTLYVAGLRLQNAASHIRNQVKSGDFPEMSLPIAETLDSVISVHGPLIMSSETGRALVKKAKDYSFDPNREDNYRVVAQDLAEKVAEADILDPQSADSLKTANDEINTGPDPRMSTQVAHSTNNNFLTKCAKLILAGAGAVMAGGLAQSNAAAAASDAVTQTANQIWTLFSSNPKLLLDLASFSGSDLSWLPSFVRWLEINKVNQAIHAALFEENSR